MASLPAEVEIPPGAGFRVAMRQLERGGVEVRRAEFEVLARLMGRERGIKAGNYFFSQAPTPLELLDKLTRGDVLQAEIRLIEGWNGSMLCETTSRSAPLRPPSRATWQRSRNSIFKRVGRKTRLKRLSARSPSLRRQVI